MKMKIKEFIKENKKILYKVGIALIISIVVAIALEISIFRNLSKSMAIDRTFIVTCALFFVAIHFIIPLKKL